MSLKPQQQESMTTEKQSDWRERFDKQFPNGIWNYLDENGENVWMFDTPADPRKIKDFIASELIQERHQLIEEVEGWLDEMPIWIDGTDMSPFRAELRTKLASLKKEK